MPADRPFDVLLLAGASGAGKSMISYPLARRYGVALVEVDDIVEAVKRLTTPGTHPWLHYWDTHPEAATLAPDRIVEIQVALAQALAPGVAAVIANHLQTDTPVVIEGDYLLPSAAAGFDPGRVRSVLVHEPEVDQYVANYAAREPHRGVQRDRAEASAAYGGWLVREAERHRVPVVAARPWATGVDRIVAALDGEADRLRTVPEPAKPDKSPTGKLNLLGTLQLGSCRHNCPVVGRQEDIRSSMTGLARLGDGPRGDGVPAPRWGAG